MHVVLHCEAEQLQPRYMGCSLRNGGRRQLRFILGFHLLGLHYSHYSRLRGHQQLHGHRANRGHYLDVFRSGFLLIHYWELDESGRLDRYSREGACTKVVLYRLLRCRSSLAKGNEVEAQEGPRVQQLQNQLQDC